MRREGAALFRWESCGDAGDPARRYYRLWEETAAGTRTQVHVYPGAGFKTTGLFRDGEWYGPAEPDWSAALGANPFLGAPILFPTPNRVRDQAFTFRGRRYEMVKNGRPRAQHGIAYDSAWECGEPAADADGVSVTGTLTIAPGDENYAAYPFPCRLTVRYRLSAGALEVRFRVENTGDADMPWGVGLHPCFSLRSAEEPVLLTVPARAMYEVTPDLLATGKLLALDGDENRRVDLGRDVKTFRLDNGFLLKGGDTVLKYPGRGTQLRICTTPDFTVSVVYTPVTLGQLPASMPLFFVEHQTCCTDAINLYEAGVPDTGLLILRPGGAHESRISYIFEELT